MNSTRLIILILVSALALVLCGCAVYVVARDLSFTSDDDGGNEVEAMPTVETTSEVQFQGIQDTKVFDVPKICKNGERLDVKKNECKKSY